MKGDEWAKEAGMRWDSWDALASKRWVRMEDSGRVDDEGRPILEKVDLIETFFAGVSKNHGGSGGWGACI